MNALRDVIERRVNVFGVSEPLVQIENNGFLSSKDAEQKLIVELPGVTDVDEAIKSIGQTPFLDFKILTQADLKTIDDQKLEGEARVKAIDGKAQGHGS
jgi:preprotein translocase subunit SecD